jgi:FG-GAP repeat protein
VPLDTFLRSDGQTLMLLNTACQDLRLGRGAAGGGAMGQRIRSSSVRCLAVLAAPLLVLGVMAGTAPASAASPLQPLPHQSGGRTPADAAAPAAVPASLRAAIGESLGTSASAAGYSQRAELTASGGTPDDDFGFSVALSASGTTALVGADSHIPGGAAYVFTLRGGTWSRTAELTAFRPGSVDEFGDSVALSASGTTALIGAPGRNMVTGAAYVFRLRGGTWSRAAELTASRGAQGDDFGESVALSSSGTTALAGAPGRNSYTGAAYVFRLRGSTWSRAAELTASRGAQGDEFGWSVALSSSGSTALAGAPARNSYTGAAYVFRLRGSTWSQAAELTASRGARFDAFGDPVVLSATGTTALVGAAQRNMHTGAVYVFRLRGGTWSQAAELTASHGAPDDSFGDSVALSASGITALVGAPGRNQDTGAAYLFTLRGGTWSQAAELAASHGAPDVDFGISVALSASGTTALAGAPSRPAAYVFAEGGRA